MEMCCIELHTILLDFNCLVCCCSSCHTLLHLLIRFCSRLNKISLWNLAGKLVVELTGVDSLYTSLGHQSVKKNLNTFVFTWYMFDCYNFQMRDISFRWTEPSEYIDNFEIIPRLHRWVLGILIKTKILRMRTSSLEQNFGQFRQSYDVMEVTL